MNYQCKHCGKTFTPKHSKYHTYCTYQCFTDYRNSKGLMPCPICGKVFKPYGTKKGEKTKYCSPECQYKSMTKRTEGICLQCGKVFWPKESPKVGTKQRFCTVSCAAIYSGGRRRKYATLKDRKAAERAAARERNRPQSEAKAAIRAKERERLVAERVIEKQKAKDIRDAALTKVCDECGDTFIAKRINQPCCTAVCAKKRHNRMKYLNRETRLKYNGDIDPGLSLTKLIKRDKNACHICGMKCDKADSTKHDAVFIVGPQYPSIDHLLPISRGGKHAWDNVKLAHVGCNAGKSNAEVYELASGQMKLAV